jgi:HEAT repeat protein
MLIKSLQKPLAFLKISVFLFVWALNFPTVAELVNENITNQDIIAILQLPMKERVMRLNGITGIRDRLKQLAFDRRRSLDVRWRSITALGSLSAKSYRWEMEEALKSQEWFMRNAALIAIQHDDRGYAIRWSKKLLSDPALVVRTQAVKNLIDLKADAKEEIWSALFAKSNFHNGQSLWVRGLMAQALVQSASRSDEKRFLRLLMDPDSSIQKWAVIGLEKSTGLRLSNADEPIALQKRKWLARLSSDQI